MIVGTASPVNALSGTVEGCDLVYSTIEGRIQARRRNTPRQPDSADQQLIRNYATLASRNWDTLSETQRAAWQAYAEAYFPVNSKGVAILPSGLATYMKANVIRQVLGLTLSADAPTEAPPSPVTSVAQVDGLDPDTLGLTLVHGYTTLSDLKVLVRATAPMLTVARRPRRNDQRYVRGVSPNSSIALPASGLTVQFTPTRFSVEDGQRYGVEVRVVRTTDGILSRPTYGDFIKAV